MKWIKNIDQAKEVYDRINAQFYEKNAPSFIANDFLLFSLVDEQNQAFLSIYQSKKEKAHYSIGNFQCLNDQMIAHKLFDAAVQRVKKTGGQKILGPMHGNTYYAYRFTEHLKEPFSSEMIHKAYYPNLWREYGFEVEQRYFSSVSAILPSALPVVNEKFSILKRANVAEIEPTKLLRDLHDFSVVTFSRNPLFENISFKAFTELYNPLLPLLVSPICQVIYDKTRIVGLFFAFPDSQRPKTVVVKTLARLPGKKYKGLVSHMGKEFIYQAYQLGFRQQIHAYFHEDNRSKQVSQSFGGEIFKSHLLYSLNL